MSLFKSKEQYEQGYTDMVTKLLLPGEEIEKVLKIGAEFIAITNKRLIAKDMDGIFDKSPSINSIPFSKISGVSFVISANSLTPIIPGLKIFGSGFSIKIKGFEANSVHEAHNLILAKIL